jgi:hypothetical protein
VLVICASDLRRRSSGGDIAALVRASSDAGAGGILLGGGCLLGDVGIMAAAALSAGLAVPAVSLPLPERALAAGKRLPRLAAADADERDAAIALAGEGLAAATAIGAGRALLDFGPVSLRVARAEIAGFFQRRQLDEDEPGAPRLEAAIAERRAAGRVLADACHRSLERLCRQAEARGATLLLQIAPTPWEVPSPREAAALLESFRGAPLAPVWDPGRLSVLRALGLPLSDERARALAAASGAALENDAVGMAAGYLPGLGERDETLPARPTLPSGAPIIVTGTSDVTDAEVAEAVRAVTARYAAAA